MNSKLISWIFPISGLVTDSKTIYLLGSATKFARVNGLEIPLALNGNFAYVYDLVLGENLLTLELDGQSETRTVIAKASLLTNPIAYAKPYVAFTDANSQRVNILRSILVNENSIMIPLAKEPVYKLECVDSKNYLLVLSEIACDLDWVYYQSEVDNIVIQEDNIVVQGSKILIPIKFRGHLLSSFSNGFLELKSGAVEDAERASNADISQLRPLLCIDPGHGGSQLGAISPRGVYEKDLNLEVALKLRDELIKLGKQVIMTRETDIDVSLARRVEISAKADLFISLHHNALPDGRDPNLERGISLHYYHAHSRELAQALLNDLCAATKLPRHGLYWQNLHVLRENPKPALLIELGFLIHPEESEIIVKADYQNLCVETISTVITSLVST